MRGANAVENARVAGSAPSKPSFADTAGPSGALRVLFWLRTVAIVCQIAAIAGAHYVAAGALCVAHGRDVRRRPRPRRASAHGRRAREA